MNSENGWENSAQAWIDDMDRGAVARTQLLDAVMLDLCEIRPGLRALDVGCGEGRFCRMLQAQGVNAIGIEPTESLLSEARGRDALGEYVQAFAESLPFENDSFDAVISYLTLIDIEDFRAAIAEMTRVLKTGGKLVVANLTAIATATPHLWWRDENGNKLFWTVDNYMTERPEWVEWRGIRVVNWHRPLSAYMKAFLAQNLILEFYDEPLPAPELLQSSPDWQGYDRKPDFNVMRWRKS